MMDITKQIVVILALCIKFAKETDVYFDGGSTHTLVCPVRADTNTNIRWYGPPNLSVTLSLGLDINPSIPDELESRLSITGDVSSGEYNLRITNIQQSDKGGYRCSGLSGGLQIDQHFNLFIRAVGITDVFVDDGSTHTIVCPIKPDTNKSIKWNGPPNLSVTLSFGLDINPSIPDELESRLSITGDVSSGEYNLRITNIQQSDEGGYRCSGISGGLPIYQHVNLFIRVAPLKNPSISTDPSGDILAGSNIKLICTVPGGKPLAVISWECTGSGQPESGSNSSTAISTVQLHVNKNDNGKTCKCIGSHPLWTSQRISTITMDVKYAPDDNLSIQQRPSGGIVRDNVIRLTCTVTGGNPLATLIWDCTGTKTNETTGNIASYSVTFNLYKTDNNRVCTCSATHVVTSYNPSMKHTLHVYYEPGDDPILSQTPPGYIISNSNVVLTCEVSGGNPLATLSWNCTGTLTNNTSVHKASYSVELTVDRTFNNKICACLATHRIASYNPIVRHLLVVYFEPSLDNTSSYSLSHVSAKKNTTLQLKLTVIANPTPTVEWTFMVDTDWNVCNFSSIVSNTTTNGFLTSSSIFIAHLQGRNFGDYIFTARNTVGVFVRRLVVMEEASLNQKKCGNITANTSIFVAGVVTFVLGLLSIMGSVMFAVRTGFKNKVLRSSKSDDNEYTDVQRNNPAFTDEYTTFQSDIELRSLQEQITTYEECGTKCEPHDYETLDK